MNKRIRSMIDEIFSEMKMTAENLALRDGEGYPLHRLEGAEALPKVPYL